MYPISFPIIEDFCMSTSSALIKLLDLKTPHWNRFFLLHYFLLFIPIMKSDKTYIHAKATTKKYNLFT